MAAVLVGLVAWAVYGYFNVVNKLAPSDPETAKEVKAALDTPAKESANTTSAPEYIIILGTDARPGQTRARSDTILIARVDATSKSVTMLSIPRDSRVAIKGHGLDKITHANAFGGPALAIKTVKAFTGLPISHYVEINFAGFANIVDAMGGVVINVDRAINDSHGSDTGGVSNVTTISKGVQTLNGAQALTFVRSRAFADGDFTRIKHQQQFLKALATQALQSKNLMRLPAIISSAADNIETDMSVPQIVSFANEFRGFSGDSIRSYTVPGRTARINGVSYVIPDEEAAQTLIAAFAAGQEPAR